MSQHKILKKFRVLSLKDKLQVFTQCNILVFMTMQTLPLEAVFTNDRFIQASSTVQIAVVWLLYWYVRKGCVNFPPNNKLRAYVTISDVSWYRYGKEILSIFEEITPEICKIKRVTQERAVKCGEGAKNSVKTKRKAKLAGNLTNEVEANPPPLVPQLSSRAAEMRQVRIVNEQQFKAMLSPKPAVTNPAGGLIEKPNQ